ncbi:MAG: pirin family protein [Nitrososphaeraceae archaeon]
MSNILEQNKNKKEERSVFKIMPSIETNEGNGIMVHRAFPNNIIREFDPFLLLDDMGPIYLEPNTTKGFPEHPHRGFETVTYMLEGYFEHKDSKGNSGDLGPGDVQWMTAGSGIIHSEIPQKEFAVKGGRLHGFQLWINLPKRDKMTKPKYQNITKDKVPVVRTTDGKTTVKIIAGEIFDSKSTVDTKIPINYFHINMKPGTKFTQKISDSHNVFIYVISGKGLFGKRKQEGKSKELILFEKNEGKSISIESPNYNKNELSFLLISGNPINEPIVRYGPFVMNTREEINQAVEDFKNGEL